MTILITGGSGFIGSNLILDWLNNYDDQLVNLDKLTYAGRRNNLRSIEHNAKYTFIQGDISNRYLLKTIFSQHKPKAIINLAAESHVDRSINEPSAFIQSNIVGTFNLLNESLTYWNNLPVCKKEQFRFIHISTDEVYGTLLPNAAPFTELHRYQPNSPYSASKAASDHLVRAWHQTYDLPTIITNCSNNYGPFQFPEKLIPLIISNALQGEELPIYGDGKQIRDWLYVKDHCDAIRLILTAGSIGKTYNIGGNTEKTNIEIVQNICSLLDEFRPRNDGHSYINQLTHVTDRPGHDRRYAINSEKIEKELGWKPKEDFSSGIRKTVLWYLNNTTQTQT